MPQMYCSLRGLLYSSYAPPTFGRSHVHWQISPRPHTMREILVARVELCGRELTGNFASDCDFHVNSGIFYMPQIYDTGPTALLPFLRKACWGFFRPEKSWRLWPGLNPRTWVLKGSTLPLDHRSRWYIYVLVHNADQYRHCNINWDRQHEDCANMVSSMQVRISQHFGITFGGLCAEKITHTHVIQDRNM